MSSLLQCDVVNSENWDKIGRNNIILLQQVFVEYKSVIAVVIGSDLTYHSRSRVVSGICTRGVISLGS